MNFLHPRTAMIAEAESLSHHAVLMTERKQAAYRAWFLSDPFAKTTFRRSLQGAAAEQQSTLGVLFDLVEELGREGLASYAANLWQTTLLKCEVAIDLAHNRLMQELARLPADADTRKDSRPHEPEGTQPRTPAARPGRPAEAAGDLSDLLPPDLRWPQGRTLSLLRDPAPRGEGRAECA